MTERPLTGQVVMPGVGPPGPISRFLIRLDWTGWSHSHESHHLWPWEDGVLHLPWEHPFEGAWGISQRKDRVPPKVSVHCSSSPSLHPVSLLVKGPSLLDGASIALSGCRQCWPFLEDMESPLFCRRTLSSSRAHWRIQRQHFYRFLCGRFIQPHSSL